jgi:hypothetical protein
MSLKTICKSVGNKIIENTFVRLLTILTGAGIFFIGIPLFLAAIAYFLGMTELSPVALVFSKHYVIWFLATYLLVGSLVFFVVIVITEVIIPIAKGLIEFIIYG